MKGKLDTAKMEAAFRRAADKAVHGTREERSGRFAPEKERPDDWKKRKAVPNTSRSAAR
jgi:hypothetical protein